MIILESEPKGNVYRELIDIASSVCSQFILVIRDSINLNDNAIKSLSDLKPFLQETKQQQEWPGTQLLRDTATVNYYLLNEKSKQILNSYTNNLYSWVQPDLPEDLSFIKSDGKAWLINTSHENFSYVDTDSVDEIRRIKSIQGIKVRDCM